MELLETNTFFFFFKYIYIYISVCVRVCCVCLYFTTISPCTSLCSDLDASLIVSSAEFYLLLLTSDGPGRSCFEFQAFFWSANEVFFDVCWQCFYGPSSKFIIFMNEVCIHCFDCWNVYISPRNMSVQAPPAFPDGY